VITAVDTDVFLDVLSPDSEHAERSEAALVEALELGSLVICEAVYAELASRFNARGELRTFLRTTGIELVPSNDDSLELAGAAWRLYTSRRPRGLTCPSCGAANSPRCRKCRQALRARQHIIADFTIGAHAVVLADRLLTRDRGYYRTYFPSLVID
jgi:predicted nucleic acid-binding protein